ncbi:pyridoxal phosphate-dependent aminotransferase (plasmid) [Azospirillum baldaniorum]|uniref:Kynurenine-oxoglutarate transaminase n=2 Tax=Azospirillum baldaniorum TaxID=1064539 RepID=A0A9P1JW08_9PROT|nr:aminotransferase [Azospirillum baldaniorum]AWJ92349.1 pyridoxal phosphate-dependent aminotransferase [Azospirillum baldaniorum]TWA66802.1 aspartate/methionine/tyrosine aminotransferase [Azospirillum baldaniorum]TWA75877.1 aspartate/methionine/tyrosine aminotransferase [Azospirillum brasilense]CCD00874.1 Kynurenine-oxoglutarate transaminase [Azospirillum baldaniorum]
MQNSGESKTGFLGRRELDLPVTIFEVMSRLSDEHKAINLGQGFPDERGPADVLDVAAKAILEGWNQYPPMMGTPDLRQALAAHGRRFYGLDIDWKTEVLVTSGATEALTASLLGLIEPGDEVVLFQPMYDSYLPIVRLAGGVPRFVSLKAPDWSFTRADLEAAFSPKTKLVLINDPLNPAAKVFSRAELELLAEFVQRFDAFAVCDEVYEHIVFDGRQHIPLMTLPGMRDRCLKIGSAGKTFSLTGWKVGYVTGAPHLLQPVAKAHQYITFTTPPNLQTAVAYGLGKDDAYFAGLSSGLQAKRDRLADGLRAVGFEVLPSAGTYFVVADVSPFGFDGNDEAFCRRLTAEAGVTAIPVGAFFVQDAPRSFIRFCFSKRDEILDGAVERLRAYFTRK